MNSTPPSSRAPIVITGELFRSARTLVLAGRAGDGRAVIVKTPVAPIPDASELARYRRERALLDALDGPGIPSVVDLIESDGSVRLVMGQRGGRSLSDWMAEGRLSVDDVLTVLEEAAVILGRVHAAGVIHRDVTPGNLVWGRRGGTLQLVDFGISVREGEAAPQEGFEGTLRYIAPEATGRSGHRVTWRTDLYGLGATAWHLLVGRAPFEDDDPLALVHAHLARMPEAPHRVAPAVPPCLSAVVLRLMEKDPERRYQSAEGLGADLRRCREAVARGEPGAFELGTDDAPLRFAIPDRLYGREGDLAALCAALDGAGDGGVSLALVEGPSGIGKSALVEQLADPGRRRGARMARGRFEQLGRDTPMKAVSEACEALVAALLALDEARLARTRERLRSALGDASGLLARTIPALRALLGELPPAPELGGQAAAVRVMQAHAALLDGLADAAHPIVVFLDDLQWADVASLDLIGFLTSAPGLHGLLIIGSYRSDEVGPAHPLHRMCERIEVTRGPITRVRPRALDLASTAALVADACRCAVEVATPLAKALHERTGGNPFFLRTLLQQMHDRGLLRRQGTSWSWLADAPGRLGFADNVVNAVLERLTALPDDTARALGVAARIGQRFDLRLLALALERSEVEVAASLHAAVGHGLVRPESEAWGLLAWGAGDRVGSGCQFVHDRVREAALQLLPGEEAPLVHLRLARILTRGEAPTGEALFDALEHYRAALAGVDEDERTRIALLAIEACAEAVRSAAFDVALRACELGLLALGRREPALWERLCTRAVEVADAAADDEALDRHADALIAGASSVAAMAPAYVARIRAQTRAARFSDALDTANAFLARVGRRMETRLRPFAVAGRLARVLRTVRGRSPEELVNGPMATDPTEAAVLNVRVAAARALVSAHPAMAPMDILDGLDQMLTHGVTPEGLFVWTGWSILVAEVIRRPDLAARYGELALDRAERLGASSWTGIAWVQHAVLRHWRTPLPEIADALLRTRERGIELGELDVALAAGFLADQIGFYVGRTLAEVDLSLRHSRDLARQYRTSDSVASVDSFRRLVAALRGEKDPGETPGGRGSDGSFAEQDQIVTRLISAIFLGDREAGWRASREVPAAVSTPLRGPPHFIWWTYRSVALLRAAAAGCVSAREARRLARPGRRHLERWAEAVPARGYRLLWIDAADAALGGRHAEALAAYERAITLCQSLGIRHDAALMAEHAAEVAAAAGQHRLRGAFLEEASAGYRQWGALRKVEQLVAMVPARPSTSPTSATPLSSDLDVETMFRASLALAGELRLDRLVGEVVAVTIQNAGATRGFLVTEEGGGLFVEVGRSAEGVELVATRAALSEVREMATTVVQYVARTGEQLVLADGTTDPRFASDPYLQGRTIASILCTPLVHKGRRTGIIYLENHLVGGTFTPARLRTVQVLASQAAVSIQNAGLVDNLEARVAERTEALRDALAQTRAQHRRLEDSQHALVQSEKMAALGQLVAGVAHELNTPLGAIRASVGNLSSAVEDVIGRDLDLLADAPPQRRAEWVAMVRRGSARTALRTSREERGARRKVIARLEAAGIDHGDDLAALLVELGIDGDDEGELSAHGELLRDARRDELLRGAYNVTSIVRNSQNIRTAADRAAKIVFALKSYAHPGGAAGESTRAALADNLDTVLTLYHHHIKHHVDLVRDYQDAGLVEGRHDELNQVWTNLVHNALQAMDYKGRMEVGVHADGGDVVVSVTDSGRGVPAAQLGRIFEPFFTTKAVGEGSGLGLSICHDIVRAHDGDIAVESEPGRTRFTVRLPRERPR